MKTGGLLANYLYRSEEGRQRYRETLLSLLDEHWDEGRLLAEVDRLQEMIAEHARRPDRVRSELERVREFILTRREELLAELSEGMPPAHDAIAERRTYPLHKVKTVRQVLGSGPIQQDLTDAAPVGDLDVLRRRIAEGANLDAKDESGGTALAWAAYLGHADVVTLLLRRTARGPISQIAGACCRFEARRIRYPEGPGNGSSGSWVWNWKTTRNW